MNMSAIEDAAALVPWAAANEAELLDEKTSAFAASANFCPTRSSTVSTAATATDPGHGAGHSPRGFPEAVACAYDAWWTRRELNPLQVSYQAPWVTERSRPRQEAPELPLGGF